MQAKNDQFSERLQRLAAWAKVLSHPARIAIVELLASRQSCISGDIALELPLSRSTVSQHLQELKQMGLIKGEISGLNVNYCLDREVWAALQRDWQAFLALSVGDFPCNC